MQLKHALLKLEIIMAQAPVLNRASLSQQIRDSLFERILTGDLMSGDRLVELRIAQEMGTSQAPVREALRELEAIGVIDLQRNKGARVRTFDAKELCEIYGVRAELEGYASDIVARVAPEVKTELEGILVQMLVTAEQVDSKGFAKLNFEFHGAIVRASGNRTLSEIWEGLHVRSRTHINLTSATSDLVKIAKSHQVIIDTIADGQPDLARQAAFQHVRDNMPEQPPE
jgi:DNA-binding GntR family transcriptional regulator